MTTEDIFQSLVMQGYSIRWTPDGYWVKYKGHQIGFEVQARTLMFRNQSDLAANAKRNKTMAIDLALKHQKESYENH